MSPRSIHVPALVWTLLTAVALWMPASELPETPVDSSIADPLAHLILFLVLAVLWRRSIAALWPGRSPEMATLGAAALWALLLEVGQIWIPGRGWQVADLVLDGLGVLAGLLLARRFAGR